MQIEAGLQKNPNTFADTFKYSKRICRPQKNNYTGETTTLKSHCSWSRGIYENWNEKSSMASRQWNDDSPVICITPAVLAGATARSVGSHKFHVLFLSVVPQASGSPHCTPTQHTSEALFRIGFLPPVSSLQGLPGIRNESAAVSEQSEGCFRPNSIGRVQQSSSIHRIMVVLLRGKLHN